MSPQFPNQAKFFDLTRWWESALQSQNSCFFFFTQLPPTGFWLQVLLHWKFYKLYNFLQLFYFTATRYQTEFKSDTTHRKFGKPSLTVDLLLLRYLLPIYISQYGHTMQTQKKKQLGNKADKTWERRKMRRTTKQDGKDKRDIYTEREKERKKEPTIPVQPS